MPDQQYPLRLDHPYRVLCNLGDLRIGEVLTVLMIRPEPSGKHLGDCRVTFKRDNGDYVEIVVNLAPGRARTLFEPAW